MTETWLLAALWLGLALVATMLEFGLNTTNYGKTVLAACFINDLLTVLALGFIFSPFTTPAASSKASTRSLEASSRNRPDDPHRQ